jgi:hypothetical protein
VDRRIGAVRIATAGLSALHDAIGKLVCDFLGPYLTYPSANLFVISSVATCVTRYTVFGRRIVMMSERVSELRRRLAERLPKSRTFSGSAIPMRGAAPSVDFQITALIRNLSKGAITELVAEKKSSGSALFIAALLRQAAETNQIVALVDGLDSFDPTAFSNETLSRLLWVRCKDAAQALKAVDLILRDRNLPLVLLDLRINPEKQLRKLPSSIWYRLQRIVETTGSRMVVLTPNAMVGSAQIRLNLQSQFDLSALQKSESELLSELRIEISRNRLHVEPKESPEAGLVAAG